MARLPVVGSDDDDWGNLLNEFLSVEHNSDGTLKSTGSLASTVHLSGTETITGTKTFNAGTFLDKGTEVFNVKAFGAIGDNVTDDTAAIQSAINAVPANGGIVFFPAGIYRVGSPLTLKSKLRLQGVGPSSRLNSVSSMFTWSSHVSLLIVEGLYLVGGGGHVFAVGSAGIHQSSIRDCVLVANSTSHSIWYQDNADSYIEIFVERCDMWQAVGATVPAWTVKGSIGALNSNVWRNCRFNAQNNNAAPFVRLEETASANFAYDNRFEQITAEQCLGGVVHAYSVQGLMIDGIFTWDAPSAYADDIIKIGKSSTGAASRMLFISHVFRRGNSLAAGVYDINLIPGEVASGTSVIVGVSTTSGTPASLNYPAGTMVIGAAGLSSTSDVQIFTSSGTWNKPAWAGPNAVVNITCIAGGAGGGSGRRGAAGTIRCGGGGGGVGGTSKASLPASVLGSTVTVTVGAGGTGGAAVTANNTDGNPGGNGGQSSFGTYVLAGVNTTGGAGGTTSSGTGGAAGSGNIGGVSGGGSASTTGGAGGAGGNGSSGGSGGAGGGITSANVANAGGAGGRTLGGHNVSASGGVVGGAAPGNGYSQPANSGLAGNGGGGGAASTSGAAQSGGNGGIYGAPGGGGGASLNGNNSGAGGNGANGIVVVITSL